jgi:arabinogalactan oligomer/maltooligosaccharide transport system permease protein
VSVDAPPRPTTEIPPDERPGPRTSLGALLLKIILLSVVSALGLYGTVTLWFFGATIPALLMAVGTLLVLYIYVSKRHIPAKYFAPGIAFLLVYQVFTVSYTGLMAFTNYGDGHNSTQENAISAILAKNENRVADSVTYPLTVVQRKDTLGFLLTDPTNGSALLGTAADPLETVTDVTKNDDGKAVDVRGWTTLSFADILANQKAIIDLRVPFSDDPNDGSIRTPDGSNGYVYLSTLSYDAATNTLIDSATGVVYTDSGKGNFVGPDGKKVEPGWRVFVGLENFTSLVTNESIRGPFLGVLVWTFAFSILSVLTCFALGLGLAIVLNDPKMKGRKTYRSLLLIPYAFPAFLSALVWAGMLNQDFGFVNQVILRGADIPWLTEPWPARFSVLLVNLWLGFPYMFLVSTGALQSIPAELTEAAKVDGASGWRIFQLVKLPLLLVSLMPLLIASFAFNFNNFNLIYFLTGGGPRDIDADVDVGATDILISFTYKIAFGGIGRNYGLACAVSVLIFLIVASISAISFRRTRALEELN